MNWDGRPKAEKRCDWERDGASPKGANCNHKRAALHRALAGKPGLVAALERRGQPARPTCENARLACDRCEFAIQVADLAGGLARR